MTDLYIKSRKGISMVMGLLIAVLCIVVFIVIFWNIINGLNFMRGEEYTALGDVKIAIEKICQGGYESSYSEIFPLFLPADNGASSSFDVRYFTLRISAKNIELLGETGHNNPNSCGSGTNFCYSLKTLKLDCPKNIKVSPYEFEALAGPEGQNPREEILLNITLVMDERGKGAIKFEHDYA